MVFWSRYMPCERCGASVDAASSAPHECAPERAADFQMFALRDDVADFEPAYRAYLGSRDGRFETWLAAQQVRGAG
jgi:hypothetical protein